jgi:2-oxoglutarate dehydrogenase complex dehydrogenase (E1) component-like enzyme
VTSHIAASVQKDYSHIHTSTTTTSSNNNENNNNPSSGAGQKPPLRVSLLHNPSHLEIIGSVAAGESA